MNRARTEEVTSLSPHAAAVSPDKPAAIMAGTGETLTYGELEARSCQLARLFVDRGLAPGDRVGIMMENRLDWFVAIWAARRATLYFVPINWHLQRDEARYLVENSDVKALVTSDRVLDLVGDIAADVASVELRLTAGSARDGFLSLADAIADYPVSPMIDERQGNPMFYSSGTSGRPKGILRTLRNDALGNPYPVEQLLAGAYRIDADSIYLSPAPQYHGAPMGWTMTVLVQHGTIVMMESFDPENVLRAIEAHKVTHAQFVPTHFVRLLRLPEDVRRRYDLSSLKVAVHAAAPCSREVKQAMIDWWGPVIEEYYGGSEAFGVTVINSEDWLAHPGSVGKSSLSGMHIVNPETGEELPPGEVGLIYFDGVEGFAYHKDSEKTRECVDARGWGTHGDMGWADEEGWLYLADRKDDLVISGGVNIYPQEIENILILHDAVHDVAVFGIPNEEYGEEVKAMVQLRPGLAASEAQAADLIGFCRSKLAHFKCPRTVDFVDELPRHPNGKMLKRQLRARFWPEGKVKI